MLTKFMYFLAIDVHCTIPPQQNMEHEMSLKHIPLTIIVAATPKNGIGKNGALPWPMLKKEMAYFARVTKRVPMPTNNGSVQSETLKQTILDGTRRNAVIMGRKTWDSIPVKFRPLKERTNIVISSQNREQLGGIPDDVVVAQNITDGLESLEKLVNDGKALSVGRAFVIGGSSIYQRSLELPQTKHILLTEIHKDYECDTFFPVNLDSNSASESGWQRKSVQDLRNFIGEELPAGLVSETSNDTQVEFEYQLYERD